MREPADLSDLARELTGMKIIHPGGFAISEAMITFAGAKLDGEWLDTSCCSGESLAHLAATFPAHLTGIDISTAHVGRARQRLKEAGLRADVEIADATALPFAASSFDLVYSECTASLFDKARCLPEWQRVLRPGGAVAIHDIYWIEAPEPTLREAERTRLGGDPFTRDEWLAALEQAGFTDIEVVDRTEDLQRLRAEVSQQVQPEELSRVFFESIRRHGWRRAGLFYFLYLWLGEPPGRLGYLLIRGQRPS